MNLAFKIIGNFAAILTTLSFLPQAWKVYKTHKTEDISLWMWIIFTIGILLWIIYGIALQDWNLILANGITAILSIYILIMKLKYTKKPNEI